MIKNSILPNDESRQAESSPLHRNCCGREIFNNITSKWVLLIVFALDDQVLRFYEIRDKVEGISEKMLSQKLKMLMRDGLVERCVEDTSPPKVSYYLTGLGLELAANFRIFTQWIAQRIEDIHQAQKHFEENTNTS